MLYHVVNLTWFPNHSCCLPYASSVHTCISQQNWHTGHASSHHSYFTR